MTGRQRGRNQGWRLIGILLTVVVLIGAFFFSDSGLVVFLLIMSVAIQITAMVQRDARRDEVPSVQGESSAANGKIRLTFYREFRADDEDDTDDFRAFAWPPSDRPVVRQFECKVVGEIYYNDNGQSRQGLIRDHVRKGERVLLLREPDNPHDANAIAVLACERFRIGYLKREVAARLCHLIDDQAYEAEAYIHKILGGTRRRPTYGVILALRVVETGLPKIHAAVGGEPVSRLVATHKDDLDMMLKCCEAEESAYRARPQGRRYPPAVGAFRRAAILARKSKDYRCEVDVCQRWLALVADYSAQPIVDAEGWDCPQDSAAHRNIVDRLPKALRQIKA